MITDAFRLAVGTLTVLRVPPPGTVDRRTAATAMIVAPLAVLPLGVAVGLVVWAGGEIDLASPVVAVLAVGLLALASRALHLDGLADTADALTASYDRERSLTIMRSGSTGPAGAAALVLVLALQVTALAAVASRPHGWLLAGVVVCVSRAAVTAACLDGIPAARTEGLGAVFAGSVSRAALPVVVAVAAAAVALASEAGDVPWWRGIVAVGVAGVVVAALLARSVRRFGGVTGDTFGAAIELALAALLVAASIPG